MPMLPFFVSMFLVVGLMPIVFGFEPLDLTIVVAIAVGILWLITPTSPASAWRIRLSVRWQTAASILTATAAISAVFWTSETRQHASALESNLSSLCEAGLERYGRQHDPQLHQRRFPSIADASGDQLAAAFTRNCPLRFREIASTTPATVR